MWSCLSRTFSTKNIILFLAFKRRRRDLNPRAGYPTYTLSRGASSATWVLLQMPKYKMICAVTHSWRMVYYTKTLRSCQPVFSNFLFFSYYYRKYALQNPNQPPRIAEKSAYHALFWNRYAVTTASILFFTISAISVVFIPWYSSYGIGSRKWTSTVTGRTVLESNGTKQFFNATRLGRNHG